MNLSEMSIITEIDSIQYDRNNIDQSTVCINNINKNTSSINKNPPQKKKSKSKKRCYKCNCKLKIFEYEFKCNCAYNFCSKHKLPFNHNCEYQLQRQIENKLLIKKNNLQVVSDKVIKI